MTQLERVLNEFKPDCNSSNGLRIDKEYLNDTHEQCVSAIHCVDSNNIKTKSQGLGLKELNNSG
jgi:hypothetical protein